jgi:flagellar biogenesis protein FliO
MSATSQVQDLRVVGTRRIVVAFPEWVGVLGKQIASAAKWILQGVKAQRARKNLRVCESVSLGDKRFVAVVQVDGERFLIGGAASSVAMLTKLESKTFAAELARCGEGANAQ